MKPVFAHLRALGHISVYFMEDSCLMGDSFESFASNVYDTVSLMNQLGLTVNETKSVVVPTKQLTFLGFVLCYIYDHWK